MANKIKGITLEIGGDVQPLEKALASVNKKTRDLQGELKSVERLLKLDPGNTELIAQKQKLLGEQVENTRKKLQGLKGAQEDVNAAFRRGDLNEEQYRHFSRQVINAEQDLKKFEGQLKDVDRAADKAGRSLKDMGQKAQGIGEKATLGISMPVVGGTLALTEGTREDRQDRGKLEAAFSTSGFTAEQAKQTYVDFYGILGESDTAIEAANHLTELAKSQEELDKWVTISTGVYAKFGDSLPIEGLTEAANETAKVGKVTGQLADALTWIGISEDEVNAKMENMNSEQERQAYLADTLMGAYSGLAQKYREVNKGVIEANEANAAMKDELNDLATKIEPIVTKVVRFISALIDKFNNLPDAAQNTILAILGVAAVIGPLLMVIGKAMVFMALFGDKLGGVTSMGTKLATFLPRLGPLIAALTSPIGIIVLAIAGLILAFKRLWDTNANFRAWVRGLADTLENGFKGAINSVVDKINWLIDKLNNLPGVEIKNINKLVKDSGTQGMGAFQSMQRYATGTNFHPGGLAWVGEKGPELLNLPRGSQIYNNQESRAIANQTLTVGGVIRVEGVNDMNQLVGVAQLVAREIEQGDRRLAGRVRVMPSMA